MIRNDELRDAIAAVSAREPEIGYALNALLDARRIGPPLDAGSGVDDPGFIFENERVSVRRISLFIHGRAPLEERLVLKYGELAERHALEKSREPIDYFAAAQRIRQAGLDYLVRFEIRRAMDETRRLRETCAGDYLRKQALTLRLQKLEEMAREEAEADIPLVITPNATHYTASIESNVQAHFLRFPFCFAALRQVAEMNLEFFFVRFLLDLFVAGHADQLYAGMVRGRLAGLVYLRERRRPFYGAIEVRYVATINGVPLTAETVAYPRIRGMGTFLMAGVWLLWQERFPKVHEIVLDAEVEASSFYAAIGFDPRPPYGFVLRRPQGKLLLYIVAMAMQRAALPERTLAAVVTCIARQIKYLRRNTPVDDPRRRLAILAISSCIQGRRNKLLAETTRRLLQRYRRRIAEGDLLLASLDAQSNAQARDMLLKGASMLQVVCDPVYEQHLENIFHLESAKRIRAIETILGQAPFPDRIIRVVPRPATEEELAWAHSPDHIAAVARTAGQRIASFDLDTQATAHSYATAKLAVGGVFSLIDAVYEDDRWRCGMACIRPPGHHAGPDHAMGFCLFNNTALGALYALRNRGAQRVLIVDVDVHHGNGTQQIFYTSSEVLYFSIHQFPHYPGTGKLSEIGAGPGEGYTINVPLARGYGDREYAKILHYLLAPVARQFQPQLILVSLGMDLYAHDPLGQMNVTGDGYAHIVHLLKQLADQVCEGRILFVLEGGYSIEGMRTCGLRVLQELIDIPTLAPERLDQVASERPDTLAELKKAMEVHRKYWPVLG